jgi:hypothetical protein
MQRISHYRIPINIACVCMLLCAAVMPLQAQWQNCAVDTLTNTQIRKQTDIQSLDLDSLDFCHLVFKHDAAVGWSMYYTTNSPAGTWQALELVNDTDQVCYSPALAVSPVTDEPYITYEDDSDICFAWPTPSGWQQHMVTSDDRLDCCATIAIDEPGRVHLAWITEDSLTLDYKIAYAIGDSTDWNVQILFGSELGPYGTGAVPYIAVTETGIAHIVYRGGDYGDYHIHHAWNDSVGSHTWNYEIVTSGNVNDFAASLVIDDDDGLHLAMSGNDGWGFPGRVYYRHQPAGQTWQPYELASATNSAVGPSLALDAGGIPHIIWEQTSGNFYTGHMYYSYKDTSGAWQVAYVIGGDHFAPSFQIDNAGFGHVACHSGGNTGNYDIFHVTSADPLTSVQEYSARTMSASNHYLYHYPQPVTEYATFNYSIPTGSYVTLRIFNSLGQEITTLVNTYQPAGQYQRTWTVTDLAPGVYFYSLQAGDYSVTDKMIIVQ